jgi:hypothetical protein
MGWRREIATAARVAEERFDRFRFGIKERFGLLDPFEVLPYRGHGTPREFFLRGRVLEETGITSSGQDDTVWQNVRNMARRFASDEVAGARVRATLGELEAEVVADAEGFFDVRLELPEPISGPTRWHPVELELLHPPSPSGERVTSTGQVLVPNEAQVGIISDIDDTVVRSHATSVLKMAWIVVVNNAHARLPFEGVAEFYEALRRGAGGDAYNPIFYVSSSPWNIYDVLEDFLDVHGVRGTALSERLEPDGPREASRPQAGNHPHAARDLPRSAVRPNRRLGRARPGDLPPGRARASRPYTSRLHPGRNERRTRRRGARHRRRRATARYRDGPRPGYGGRRRTRRRRRAHRRRSGAGGACPELGRRLRPGVSRA